MKTITERFGSALLICIGVLWAVGGGFAQKVEKDFSYYEVIGSRDLFKAPVKEIKKGTAQEPEKKTKEYVNPKQLAALRNLVITGIIWNGEKGYKVILEEKGESYYLAVGDEIKAAEILKIEQDKIILGYQGKEVELLFERKETAGTPVRRSSPMRRPPGFRETGGRTRQPYTPPVPPELEEKMKTEGGG